MNSFQIKTKFIYFIFIIIFYSILTSFVFATSITGTYTGTYSSTPNPQANNYDSGTVTITIDPYGNVSCDFHSTVYGTDNIANGSINVSYTVMPPAPTFNNATVTCVNNGAGINFGGVYPYPPDTYHPFFAAMTNFTWNTNVSNVPLESIGAWFNSSGYGGSFFLNLPASPNAATAPINPAELSGLWYDPNYTGSGFNLLGSSAGLIVTYYGWDKSGNRLWLTSASPWTNPIAMGQSITLNLSQTADGTFSVPAPPSTAATWGTLTLTFTSCTAATATLSGADGNITESLALLVGLNGLGCQ